MQTLSSRATPLLRSLLETDPCAPSRLLLFHLHLKRLADASSRAAQWESSRRSSGSRTLFTYIPVYRTVSVLSHLAAADDFCAALLQRMCDYWSIHESSWCQQLQQMEQQPKVLRAEKRKHHSTLPKAFSVSKLITMYDRFADGINEEYLTDFSYCCKSFFQ